MKMINTLWFFVTWLALTLSILGNVYFDNFMFILLTVISGVLTFTMIYTIGFERWHS